MNIYKMLKDAGLTDSEILKKLADEAGEVQDRLDKAEEERKKKEAEKAAEKKALREKEIEEARLDVIDSLSYYFEVIGLTKDFDDKSWESFDKRIRTELKSIETLIPMFEKFF